MLTEELDQGSSQTNTSQDQVFYTGRGRGCENRGDGQGRARGCSSNKITEDMTTTMAKSIHNHQEEEDKQEGKEAVLEEEATTTQWYAMCVES